MLWLVSLNCIPPVLEDLLIIHDNYDKEWRTSRLDAYGFPSVLSDFDFIMVWYY